MILMLSAAAAKVLGAFFKIPLTNILGGIGMGYFSAAYSLFMPVYALTVTGISSAVARMTAQCAALGMHGDVHRIRAVGHLVFSAIGLIGCAAILLLAAPFSRYSADSPEAAAAVSATAPAVLLGCITAVERGHYEGLCNMYPTAFSQVIEGIVKVAAGLWLCNFTVSNPELMHRYFPSTDIKALAAAAGILGVTLSSLGAVMFFALLRPFAVTERVGAAVMSRRKTASELIRTAAPIGVGAVVTDLAALIDMWTVLNLIPAAAVMPEGVAPEDYPRFVYGSFAGIGLTVFNLVPSVTNMLGKSALTCAASAWESSDRGQLERHTSQVMFTAAFISVPAAFGIAAVAPELLLSLFPNQPDEAQLCITPLRLLMPGMVFVCMAYPLFSMLQGIGRAALTLEIMLAGTAAKLVGNIILIRLIGINGAAVSTTASYLVILLLSAAAYRRITGVTGDVRSLFGVLYSGVMCGGTAVLVSGMTEGTLKSLVCAAAAGGGVYIFAAYTVFGRRILCAK